MYLNFIKFKFELKTEQGLKWLDKRDNLSNQI